MKIKEHQATREEWFTNRRRLVLSAGGMLSVASTASAHAIGSLSNLGEKVMDTVFMGPGGSLIPTKYEHAISYNVFHEFGHKKDQPAKRAQSVKWEPWSVKVSGLVQSPRVFGLDDLAKLAPMEERLYRLLCVEGWSMVIPWSGYSLSHLIKAVRPLGSAKYVQFRSLVDTDSMQGIKDDPRFEWPYIEGLRIDEAQHPLSLLTFGAYGKTLLGQNGAPVRIAVPWKYGF